ncbi:hypothetical protein [Methylobacterium marchantiae]|uniref:Uncharacterized protein n=1 Tax=Methylobacterium marchantiae TaxID=600331 RepID=A0ABW3X4A4_9HYPH|nr:hypothetical protein AIGOOFII_1333 [Methylobacterium marchantiae]
MRLLGGLGLMLLLAGLFVRSYTLPPAPDRRGGTTIALAYPNRALFGSPRGDCIGSPEDEVVITCLIGSVSRFRAETMPLLQLTFCGTCYGLSQSFASLGRDDKAVQAKLAQMARFGW